MVRMEKSDPARLVTPDALTLCPTCGASELLQQVEVKANTWCLFAVTRTPIDGKVPRFHAPLKPTIKVYGTRLELQAVLMHRGSADSGHWWALTKRGRKWFSVDDAAVAATTLPTQSPYACGLLYRRIDVAPAATPPTAPPPGCTSPQARIDQL
jgi:hypothetical protein